MSATFKDVVFSTSGLHGLVWCEYRARFHTLVQVRYQVRAFVASGDEIAARLACRRCCLGVEVRRTSSRVDDSRHRVRAQPRHLH